MAVTYQEESVVKVLEEVQPLLNEHYEEVSITKNFPLNPDYSAYLNMDAAGFVSCITCRNDGELIGYIVFFVRPHLHYLSCKTAHEDIYFIKKEYRKGSIGVKLFKKAEEILKEKSVNRILLSCKTNMDHSKIFERLGYRFFEKHFDKLI
jgi:GNAT superfamily N-acetyltransferase